jgi:hypothetical protein
MAAAGTRPNGGTAIKRCFFHSCLGEDMVDVVFERRS